MSSFSEQSVSQPGGLPSLGHENSAPIALPVDDSPFAGRYLISSFSMGDLRETGGRIPFAIAISMAPSLPKRSPPPAVVYLNIPFTTRVPCGENRPTSYELSYADGLPWPVVTATTTLDLSDPEIGDSLT